MTGADVFRLLLEFFDISNPEKLRKPQNWNEWEGRQSCYIAAVILSRYVILTPIVSSK